MGFHENSYTWLMGKMGDWDHLVFASSGWCDQLLMSMTLEHSGKVMDFPGLIFWNGEEKPETERRCGPVDFGDVKLLTTWDSIEPLDSMETFKLPWQIGLPEISRDRRIDGWKPFIVGFGLLSAANR